MSALGAIYSIFFFIALRKAFPRRRGVILLALLPGFFDWLGVATFLKWTVGGAAPVTLIFGSIRASRRGSSLAPV